MKTYEAPTIAEACQEAALDNNCSISDLEYKILQYPKKGIFGLFSKKAIIGLSNVKSDKKASSVEEKKSFDSDVVAKESKDIIQEKEAVISEAIEDKENEIVDSFFEEESKVKPKKDKTTITAKELEEQIKKLFSYSCFDIDTIEVDIEDNTAYIFIDGEDAALLIGKEGYRYNALSYMLFNWLNVKYGLYLKLEIAQFLASQQDMIKNLMKPVIEHVENIGSGKTKPLNGILVQIALEYLRDVFPNKYVAIKRNKEGLRYIIINDFNKR